MLAIYAGYAGGVSLYLSYKDEVLVLYRRVVKASGTIVINSSLKNDILSYSSDGKLAGENQIPCCS